MNKSNQKAWYIYIHITRDTSLLLGRKYKTIGGWVYPVSLNLQFNYRVKIKLSKTHGYLHAKEPARAHGFNSKHDNSN